MNRAMNGPFPVVPSEIPKSLAQRIDAQTQRKSNCPLAIERQRIGNIRNAAANVRRFRRCNPLLVAT
jgi:hypothetical protein